MALTTWAALYAAASAKVDQLPHAALWVKGAGTNDFYALEVDPATGALPTTQGGPQDFGVTTLSPRMAAVIGNATGAVDYGSGVLGAQTLRVALATDSPMPLPTGAATETTLAAMSAKLPATLGQKAMTASLAVVIASDQSNVPVTVASSALPTGAATETTLAAMSAKLPSTLGQKTMANSMAVVLASDQSAVPFSQSGFWYVDVSSSALPTGAATAAKQDTGNTSLSSIDGKLATLGQKVMTGSVPVVLASDQPAIPVSQSGTWNVTNISGTISLPTGAATETTLAAMSAKLPATLGQKVMTASLAVVIASDQSAIPASQSGTWNINNVSGTVSLPTGAATEATLLTLKTGRTKANTPYRNDLSTPITTAAYTQAVASLTSAVNRVQIFNSADSAAMILATGAAASEVDQLYIPPGGGDFDLAIAASTRVSLKAIGSDTTSGQIIINFLT